MNSLQEQFEAFTGEKVFLDSVSEMNCEYNPTYVEWLESRLNEADGMIKWCNGRFLDNDDMKGMAEVENYFIKRGKK